MEAASGVPQAMARSILAVSETLEAAGIEFIDGNGSGPGVRFKAPQ
jgi:hypothetical protein